MAAEPRVHRALRRMPPAWDRGVVFVANLKSLFFGNREECDFLQREVQGVASYGGRLVPVVNLLYRGPRNLLVTESAPHAGLLAYFRRDLGLDLPELLVVPHEEARRLEAGDERFETMRAHPAEWVEGFVTDAWLGALTRRLDKRGTTSPEGSHRGNNKLLLHRFLESAGLPVFDTVVAADHAGVAAALKDLRGRDFAQAVVKSQIGASGIGLLKLPSEAEAAGRVPGYFFHEGDCMVQGWLDGSCAGVSDPRSPSVQMFVQEDDIHLYDLTEQLLDADSLHQGNVAPPPWAERDEGAIEAMLEQAAQAAAWLHGVGYRGTASADFLVVDRDGRGETRMCEINARVTGATYPSLLARHPRAGRRLAHAQPARARSGGRRRGPRGAGRGRAALPSGPRARGAADQLQSRSGGPGVQGPVPLPRAGRRGLPAAAGRGRRARHRDLEPCP